MSSAQVDRDPEKIRCKEGDRHAVGDLSHQVRFDVVPRSVFLVLDCFDLCVCGRNECQRRTPSCCQVSGEYIKCWHHPERSCDAGSMSQKTVRKWHCRFKGRDNSVNDRPCPGHARTARNPDVINQVSQALTQDKRQTVRDLAAEVGVSKSSVHNILKKDLSMSKLCPKFIPRTLTQEQKSFRVRMCELNLASLCEDDTFISRVVTGMNLGFPFWKWKPKGQHVNGCPKGVQLRGRARL